jgi:hypothetical protein
MAASEERNQDLADHALLPDDDLGELAFQPGRELRHAFERDRRLLAAGEVKAALGHDRLRVYYDATVLTADTSVAVWDEW